MQLDPKMAVEIRSHLEQYLRYSEKMREIGRGCMISGEIPDTQVLIDHLACRLYDRDVFLELCESDPFLAAEVGRHDQDDQTTQALFNTYVVGDSVLMAQYEAAIRSGRGSCEFCPAGGAGCVVCRPTEQPIARTNG